MELLFVFVLILLMAGALAMGFPVAFALPGSAILTIAAAAAAGFLFTGDVASYFYQDGPVQWLSAGVTNFRGIYWEVERDTLIAIPLFIFMGIMLQRSKIAEDLLVTMAQLFGSIPGGLGISVVLVGALLAATTGIVGATVIAMGLISLPAMLRNNYSHQLSTGTICASGTLGQIIPPSIVLIILADQLSNATDQAGALRKSEYKDSTGEFNMPTEFDITSTSAGDMFLGAFLPGLVLVGLYVIYILVFALLRPKSAPPVPYEGAFDRQFAFRVLLALVPPLTLIGAVLGSIILGIATVNQAGAIGAIGATIMAGYRLQEGKRGAFYPAILAVISIIGLLVVIAMFEPNVKNIRNSTDAIGVACAAVASLGLVIAILWSGWRTLRIDDTLRSAMLETARTTSMVFIILLGAAMLTAAFRGFGGEELVREFLTGLPGGFWSQMIVVMLVIFLLGFFLDFIEIAVVVVPIVAPILLADPEANVTAVWLGVMIGLNIQTSFLTPPFGFALFYLRGVASKVVKTLAIYRGVVPFILLQLFALGIVGLFPVLVNYLPNRTALLSETAPPPINPRLQYCIERDLLMTYQSQRTELETAIRTASNLELDVLPNDVRDDLTASIAAASKSFAFVEAMAMTESSLNNYTPTYRPLHREVRRLESTIRKLEHESKELSNEQRLLRRGDGDNAAEIAELDNQIAAIATEIEQLQGERPTAWADTHARYRELADADKRARLTYRRNVDGAYEVVRKLQSTIASGPALAATASTYAEFDNMQQRDDGAEMMANALRDFERTLQAVPETSEIRSLLAKARRELVRRGEVNDKVADFLMQAKQLHTAEATWREPANDALSAGLATYERAIRDTIGLRQQPRLSREQATAVAACLSVPRDLSLNF